MNDQPPASAPRFFQPVTLLAGALLGLVALAWAGRTVTARDWHRDFVRFHPLIAPESQYEPTVAEMRAIVRARCRPDQILVLVGGNSIFQGIGQPVEKLWSRRLQELLGDKYAVVNLAFRGSSPTDAGALVAESLRVEYPRQVYLANVPPFKGASPAGSLDYAFMLLDARAKGWLLDLPARDEVIADWLSRPDLYPRIREQRLGARLDAVLWFRELWNWWSVTRFFTFPTAHTPQLARAYRPRRGFSDAEPDFQAMPFRERFSSRVAAIEMQITRNTTAPYYEPDGRGGWKAVPHMQAEFEGYARTAFADQLKARTLIVISSNSPYYLRRLTAAEQERESLAFRDTLAKWRQFGYAAADYGPELTDDDFGDRTHLTAGGGRKLAAHLATEIRGLAARLGYLQP